MNNDKRTGSGSKLFLFIESLRGLMNSRISTEYVSIESRRDHELLIVIFRNFTNFHTVSYIIWTPLWKKCASAAPSCPIFLPMVYFREVIAGFDIDESYNYVQHVI